MKRMLACLFALLACAASGWVTGLLQPVWAANPPGCTTVSASGPVWGNQAFAAPQNSTFVAEMDATPLGGSIDAGVGLANGPQSDYTGLACIGRFNVNGTIDARDGGVYRAVTTLPYVANTTYHLRFVVNVPAHTYSLFASSPGAAEKTVASNFAFRTEQAGVNSLSVWSMFGDVGSMQGCGFGAGCMTATANAIWSNASFTAQTGNFTAQWDATPSAANIDGVMGLSNGAQTYFAGFAILVRFNTSGTMDARNGGSYQADRSIAYASNVTVHFRVVANMSSHTYSAYVTPAGGSEQILAQNYAFRTEQNTVTSLNNLGLIVDSATGSVRLCNFAFGTDPFGITELYPTIGAGREWFSSWNNGVARTLTSGQDLPYDPQFHARGDGTYTIDGNGDLRATPLPNGSSVIRMYVYDPNFQDSSTYDPNVFTTWNNVEVTFYGKAISEQTFTAYAGLVAGAKIRHVPDSDICGDRGYYGRIRFDGALDFEKEIYHEDSNGYSAQTSPTKPWSSLPHNTWIGYKLIARDVDAGTHVKLELWMDTSDGANGGAWQKMYEITDTGGWGNTNRPCASGVDPAQILPGRNLSVFIRNDNVSEFHYKKWSIREIAPLP